MSDKTGQQIGNYRLVKLLGRGSFGDVYLGQHVHLAPKQAAIKMLRLSDVNVKKFQEEAETTEKLEHPHIVRLLDFVIEEGTPFLVLDYAPGGPLRTRHPKGSQLSLDTVVAYLKEITPALQYAHDQHILHRDIKPDNILVGRQGELLLSDFGIAVLSQTGRTTMQNYNVGGTPLYMAPEQYRGKPEKASDQYALAIMVYEWLCGTVPFKGSPIQLGYQHTHEPVPRLRDHLPTLPALVEEVVMTALDKDPRRRFGRVQAFAHALEQAYKDEPEQVRKVEEERIRRDWEEKQARRVEEERIRNALEEARRVEEEGARRDLLEREHQAELERVRKETEERIRKEEMARKVEEERTRKAQEAIDRARKAQEEEAVRKAEEKRAQTLASHDELIIYPKPEEKLTTVREHLEREQPTPRDFIVNDPFSLMEDRQPVLLPEQRGMAPIDEFDAGVPNISEYQTDVIVDGEIIDLGDEGDIVQPSPLPELLDEEGETEEGIELPRTYGMRPRSNRQDILPGEVESEDALPPIQERPPAPVRPPALPIPSASAGYHSPTVQPPASPRPRILPASSRPPGRTTAAASTPPRTTRRAGHAEGAGRPATVAQPGRGRVEHPHRKNKGWFWTLAPILPISLFIFMVLPDTWSILIRVISALIVSALVAFALRKIVTLQVPSSSRLRRQVKRGSGDTPRPGKGTPSPRRRLRPPAPPAE